MVNYLTAVDWAIERALRQNRAYTIEAANTHVAALARADGEFGDAIGKFDLICPDGMPLVWVANHRLPENQKLGDRVYGPELMLQTISATQKQAGCRHFLLGGRPETLEKLRSKFALEFPSAEISGIYAPPFGPWPDEENERIFTMIRESRANFIWVGLGCPKQELWIAQNKERLPPGVYYGIGAAFAFHAGEVRQSPPILQRLGLEWAYRLAMEPKRLFRRYFTYNSLFLYYLVRDHARA